MRTAIFASLCVVAAAASVNAHGYLSSPPPRGIQKANSQVDDLKSPNRSGKICRGEPQGTITNVGRQVTLGFTITAPHVGPCEVFALDENLGNPVSIAKKDDCAAPGKVGPWTITIPPSVSSGHKVLRWTWLGQHVSPPEPYEQCIDVNIDGGSGGSTPAPPPDSTPAPPSGGASPAPSYPVSGGAPAPATPDSAAAASAPTTPPATPPAPAAPAPDAPAGGACQLGAFSCTSSGYRQCADGQWVNFACPTGTTCKPQSQYSSSISCA